MTYPKELTVVTLECCPSTNDYLRRRWAEWQDRLPVLVLSREQTSGRGRDKRRWFSGKDLGVYASFGVALPAGAEAGLMPLAAGLAAAETLESLSDHRFFIKWPNDVLCKRRRKIAGVLCEAFAQGEQSAGVVGIGMNVAQHEEDFPPNLRWTATSLAMIMAESPPVYRVAEILAERFLGWLPRLGKRDSPALIAEVNRRGEFLLDRQIAFHQGKKEIRGVYRGIAADGGVILENEKGEAKTYHSGEIVSII